jgi:hypothetical protein
MDLTSRTSGWHRPLLWFAAAAAVQTVVMIVAWALDDRQLLGAPIWAKPIKFSLSFALYAATLAWMLSLLPAFRRTGWWLGTTIVVASVAELGIITGQVIRGVRSHFNDDSALDLMLFRLMGLTVLVIYLATLLIGLLLLRSRSRMADPVVSSSLRLGLLVTLLGMSTGFLMVAAGAHTVGAPDGGPGLFFTGWSTVGGDLRIGHFLGMHALQVLPLVAVAVGWLGRGRLTTAQEVRILRIVAGGHAGVVLLTTWQALRGQPLLSPDALTLAAAAALLVVVAALLGLVVRMRDGAPPAAGAGGGDLPGGDVAPAVQVAQPRRSATPNPSSPQDASTPASR